MLRGQNSSFPQESVSPNTLRYTWQINERLTIMNTQAAALGEGSAGPDLWPRQPQLEPPAPGSPAAPGGWQPQRHMACGRPLPCSKLLLSLAGQRGCCCCESLQRFQFLISVFNDCRNCAPHVYFHIPLPALLIMPKWSQLCLLSEPRSSLPCQPEAPPQASLSGDPLPTSPSPSLPASIATSAKLTAAAKADTETAFSWYLLDTGSRSDMSLLERRCFSFKPVQLLLIPAKTKRK